MWIWLVFQGVTASAVLIWYGVQEWPAHIGSFLGLLFTLGLIAGGLALRWRDRALKPHRESYLASNESEARELKRARIIRWAALAGVLLMVVVIARSTPRHYEGSDIVVWVVVGLLLAAIIGPMLYEAAVRTKIEHGVVQQSLGAAPATPQAKRNAVIRMVSVFVVVTGVVIVDQVFHPPISAFNLLLLGVLVLMAADFIWQKMNPPRDQ